MEEIIIKSENLKKEFRSFIKTPGLMGSLQSLWNRQYVKKMAVSDFNLQLKKGEIIGLLGPNGAGKTTLMKMLTGIIVPTSGKIEVMGHTPWHRSKSFRQKIALVMGQKSQLWWDIPAMDSFLLLQKFYEIDDHKFKQRIDQMTDIFNIQDQMRIPIRRLSLGERMKMELVASLLHSPEAIFLDEPTIGLDLIAQEQIREFILDYHKKNRTTIIITSHYMADIKSLCSKLVLIFDGKKSYDGTIQKFERMLGHETNVSFSFSCAQKIDAPFWRDLDAMWSNDATQVDVRIPEELLREVTGKILKDFPVIEFNTEKMPIERVMKTLIRNPHILKNSTVQSKE